MPAVEALEQCRHLSAPGLREGMEDHGDGTWTLRDGCRVRAMVPLPRCPTCKGFASVPPGDRGGWPEDDGEWDALVEFYGVECPESWCDDGVDTRQAVNDARTT